MKIGMKKGRPPIKVKRPLAYTLLNFIYKASLPLLCHILLVSQCYLSIWYEGDPEGGCIRFLTETESERLMGLPEGWTKYGADGMEIRPLQRYKALGNAIALPCADYIMAGIYEVLADRAGKEE